MTKAKEASKVEEKAPVKKLITVKSHGVTVKVDPSAFNDLEVFDLIDEVQSGNVFKMPKLMRRIFGSQYESVLDGLKDDVGIVAADKASEFLIEVLSSIAPNSQRS